MYHHQRHSNVIDDDVDSICHELAYPTLDGGFYSDTEYACSPGGPDPEYACSPGGLDPDLFTPINVLQQKTLQHMSLLEEQLCSHNKTTTALTSHSATPVTSKRNSALTERINQSGYVYIPPTNSLMHHRKLTNDAAAKEESISPVTISSGYSSDKEEALRQLELDYTSDDHYSPQLPRHSKLTSAAANYADNKYNTATTFEAVNGTYNRNNDHKQAAVCQNNMVASSMAIHGPNQRQAHQIKTSNSQNNWCNDVAVSAAAHERAQKDFNNSMTKPVISSLQNTQREHFSSEHHHVMTGPAQQRSCSVISATCADVERLPEILPAGVRTSYTTSSGILMAPAATHCRRCRSFASAPANPSMASPFRISRNSAFQRVQHASPTNTVSSAARPNFVSTSLDNFRIADERYVMSSTTSQPSSRVTSLSDSGRGSITSFNLALSDLSHESMTSTCSSYSDCASSEQVYESVHDHHAAGSYNQYVNTSQVLSQTPPKLPKRNARPSQQRLTRKRSSLVKYDDIVKAQDIVDPSAQHMYTVADVLDSVSKLSSDIQTQQTTSGDLCVHDNFAHFVFDGVARQSSCDADYANNNNVTALSELRGDSHRSNSFHLVNNNYDASQAQQLSKSLSQPLRARQNTACQAQTKRLPKIKDVPTSAMTNSPCSKRNRRDNAAVGDEFKSPASRTAAPAARARLSRSRSLVRLHSDAPIEWTAPRHMTEVYC